jgi:hypothetical protein
MSFTFDLNSLTSNQLLELISTATAVYAVKMNSSAPVPMATPVPVATPVKRKKAAKTAATPAPVPATPEPAAPVLLMPPVPEPAAPVLTNAEKLGGSELRAAAEKLAAAKKAFDIIAGERRKLNKMADKPKKMAAAGTMAWIAFVKHIKQTMPERFEGAKFEKERLAIVGTIKAEDKEGYDAFVAKYMANA